MGEARPVVSAVFGTTRTHAHTHARLLLVVFIFFSALTRMRVRLAPSFTVDAAVDARTAKGRCLQRLYVPEYYERFYVNN